MKRRTRMRKKMGKVRNCKSTGKKIYIVMCEDVIAPETVNGDRVVPRCYFTKKEARAYCEMRNEMEGKKLWRFIEMEIR